jgi:hypothetical protein
MAYFSGTYRNKIHCRLEEALVEEAKLRGKRQCEEWIAAERQVMLDIVNEERGSRNKDPLASADVERVEQLAVGHVDYAHKFALYCAELVEDRP